MEGEKSVVSGGGRGGCRERGRGGCDRGGFLDWVVGQFSKG